MSCRALTLTSAAHCSIASACSTVCKILDHWLVDSVLPTVCWSSLQIADFEFAEMAEEPWNKVSVAREVRHSPPEALSDGVLTKVNACPRQGCHIGPAVTMSHTAGCDSPAPSCIWAD